MFLSTYLPLKVMRDLMFPRQNWYFHRSSSVAAGPVSRNLIVCFNSGLSLTPDLQSYSEMGLTWKSNVGENSASQLRKQLVV